MQTKRKSDEIVGKSKLMKIDQSASHIIRSSGENDKSKVMKKNSSKSPSKNIVTRSSARLSNLQNKCGKGELKETDSKIVDISTPIDSGLIGSTSLGNTSSLKSPSNTTKVGGNVTKSFSSTNKNSLPSNLTLLAKPSTSINQSNNMQKIQSLDKTIYVPATSFNNNYCLINETNVEQMLHKSLSATYSMKVMLASLKNDIKRLTDRDSLIRETHIKNRQVLAVKLVKAYSGYKQAVLQGLSIPVSAQRLNLHPHNLVLQVNRSNTNVSNVTDGSDSARNALNSFKPDEVIEVSEDSDDGGEK